MPIDDLKALMYLITMQIIFLLVSGGIFEIISGQLYNFARAGVSGLVGLGLTDF